jgi:hypothetical protein
VSSIDLTDTLAPKTTRRAVVKTSVKLAYAAPLVAATMKLKTGGLSAAAAVSGLASTTCVAARTCGPIDDCLEIDAGTCVAGVCFTECGPANVGTPCGAGCVACTCTAVLDDPGASDPTYSYFCAVSSGACGPTEACPAGSVCAWNAAHTAGTCEHPCPSFP